MTRTAECHCGQLKVVADGEPERVYLCHCTACQRRTGTAFHWGVGCPKSQVRIAGTIRSTSAAPTAARDALLFLPGMRQQPLLGGRPQPAGLRHRGRCFADRGLAGADIGRLRGGMHAWLGLPTVTEHHPKGRPPAAT